MKETVAITGNQVMGLRVKVFKERPMVIAIKRSLSGTEVLNLAKTRFLARLTRQATMPPVPPRR